MRSSFVLRRQVCWCSSNRRSSLIRIDKISAKTKFNKISVRIRLELTFEFPPLVTLETNPSDASDTSRSMGSCAAGIEIGLKVMIDLALV